MRPLFIAGNWKMNPATSEAAVALAEAVKSGVGPSTEVRVAVCPPSVFLHAVDRALAGSPIGLGGQNMHWQPEGAFTGEISGAMLHDAGCTHVILGHSERRHGLGETDAQVNAKLHAALGVGLIPIVCVGETRQEREADQTGDVVTGQLTGSLAGLSPEQMAGVVLAYEPVWAIGTGLTATPSEAQAVHMYIREWLGSKFGAATAARVVVQYGGSVKPDNAEELLSCPDIDGALVGGASLKAADFLGIVTAGQAAARNPQGRPEPA
jgi:triosephosphate isomerase